MDEKPNLPKRKGGHPEKYENIIDHPTDDYFERERSVSEYNLSSDRRDSHLIFKERSSSQDSRNRSEIVESPLLPVYEVKMLLSNISTLINWCVDVGLLLNGHSCSKCGSEMRWKIQDKKIYWNCITGKHNSCRIMAKIPFSYEGMTVNKMVRLLFMWYDQQPPRLIRRHIPINGNDFFRFDHTICEVCIWACETLSQKIGGNGVRVNLETGRRLGLLNQEQLVIGGIEANDYNKIFFVPFNEFNTTLSQWVEFSTEWIETGSVVYTYSDGINFMNELKWRHSDDRTLEFNTGCLAEDLFRQTLSVSEYPFKEFATYVGDYFANINTRFPQGTKSNTSS